MRALIFVLLLVAVSIQVYAAAPVPDIYIAPSYVYELTSFNSGSCGLGSCEDSNWTLKTNLNDIKLADGKSATKENIKLGGTKQLKVVYDTILDLSGTYYLKIYANNKNDLQIMPYSDNDTVSSSLVVNLTTIKNEWIEVDITSLINHTFSGTGQIILRVSNIDVVDVDIAEMWLRRPLLARDIDIIPQGVTEAEANTVVINTWALVSSSTIPAITNYSCIVNKLNNITSSGVSSVNVTDLNMVFEIGQDSSYFRVSWDANTSVNFVSEGFNYEVQCQGYIGSKLFQGFSQFVYINKEKSFFDKIIDIYNNILKILGIVEDNQIYINETRDIANQTLGLVQSLGGSVSVIPQQVVAFTGTNITAMSALIVGTSPDNGADCIMKVYYPNATVWINDQNMTSIGADGLYKTEIEFGYVLGNYQAISTCIGGTLSGQVQGYATWSVSDGVRMKSIT